MLLYVFRRRFYKFIEKSGFTICSREGLEIFVGETLKIGKGPNKLQTLGVTISGCACLDNVPTFFENGETLGLTMCGSTRLGIFFLVENTASALQEQQEMKNI